MNERDTLSGRLKRYANVSTAMSGSAVRFIGERFFGLEIDHDDMAKNLTRALGTLKGPVMKVAQMLATVPDAVPHEYAQEFLQLQADAPSMGWPFVKRRMAAELGPDWQSRFKSFDQQATAAASLGQVHKAISLEGETLACKLQYPDMRSIVEADLKQLKLALSLYEKYAKALSLDEAYAEVAERLREELNYTLEAKHIRLYNAILKDMPDVHIPRVLQDLSTERLLTMSWLEGKRLKTILEESGEFRNRLARTLFNVWYKPLYGFAVIHGDPHLGNYTFREDGSVNLLDYGCIRKFDPSFIKGVIDLYQALKNNDSDLAVHAYETWKFANLSKDMIEVLNLWARLLYEPLLDDRIRPIQKEHSGVYGIETAHKVHSELRRLGGVRPPREFVFMDRAAVGVGSVFMHLRAELNWHQAYEELIEGFDERRVKHNQAKTLTECGL